MIIIINNVVLTASVIYRVTGFGREVSENCPPQARGRSGYRRVAVAAASSLNNLSLSSQLRQGSVIDWPGQRLAGDHFLSAFLQEAFGHNPGDGGGARANLLTDIGAHLQLTAVLLLAVAMAEINDQLFRQIEFTQRLAGGAISSA